MNPRIISGLEIAAKAVAIFLAAIYGTGFLIVAIHHAQYGVGQFDPLRPKILATGLVFLLLVAVTMTVAFRIFHLFGMRPQTVFATIRYRPEHRVYVQIIMGISFLPLAIMIINLFAFLFEPFVYPRPWSATGYIAVIAIYIAVGAIEAKYIDRHPLLFVVIDFALITLLLVVMYKFGDHHQMWITLWLYAVGILSVLFVNVLGIENPAMHIEWERVLALGAVGILTYATVIYPHVKTSFGGGTPTAMTLYFAAKNPISDKDSAQVLLLEETDFGYYVLPDEHAETAFFLRRDLVSAIHFEKKVK